MNAVARKPVNGPIEFWITNAEGQRIPIVKDELGRLQHAAIDYSPAAINVFRVERSWPVRLVAALLAVPFVAWATLLGFGLLQALAAVIGELL